MRKVTFADVDPDRLSALFGFGAGHRPGTGQSLLEKHSDAVVPIASISKLMTAMVVLDAKLDMHEVIAIGDEDVDGLKGRVRACRSARP
jgi:D-alanyl-D-alanine endopeptidase (penicillin-binding protein 7)